MTSASAVRAGMAFVEITANDTRLQRTLKKVQHSVTRLGTVLNRVGRNMTMAGGAMGLPMVLAARQAASFEDALLELKGATAEITPKQLKAVREEALRLSQAMGVAPEEIAQSFAMLIKAGMTVKQALGGAAKAAVEFAKVSGVDAQEAATFMKVAMNTFEVSAKEAVDTLSAAADSSETDIRHMVEAFSLVGSAGKTFKQSLFGISQAFAALARYGIQGEEAGTGIKVLLSRLVAPSNEAAKALGILGLSVESFRDQEGNLLPIVQIVDIISKKLRGMNGEAREKILAEKALVDVFGDRGIKVISAFADMGQKKFDEIADAMESSRTVAEKFSVTMEGITGAFTRMWSAVSRLAIAFMVGAGPALTAFSHAAAFVIDKVSWMLTNVPVLSPILAGLAAVLAGLGVGALVLGGALQVVNWGLRGWISIGPTFTMMTRAMTVSVHGLTLAFTALSAAIKRIPVIGWILAAIAAVGGIALWMASGTSETKKKSPKPGIKRDQPREPLAPADAAPVAASTKARGESLGTFAASVASQLGIGPSLTSAEETANNTARTADGVEELVAQNQARIPGAAGLQAGLARSAPGVSGGVGASSDRDLLSANERAALAAEKANEYLRQLVERTGQAGVAFV